ncbi:het [Neofusicoccum parvum]|nr:het [Neofusicoccum parvum]
MLIDVQNRCLVAANSGFRYSVLSYVWGNDISFLRTTKANVGALHKDQALSREAGVPTLIDDAIEFMKALGEKYLWVDSLCLVQDDAEKKYAGIRHMHTVFARAHLTIVAASAKDANAPLAGFRSGTRDPLSSLEIGGKRLEKIEGNSFNEMDRSVYTSRAWTL